MMSPVEKSAMFLLAADLVRSPVFVGAGSACRLQHTANPDRPEEKRTAQQKHGPAHKPLHPLLVTSHH